ncbi:MAG: AAA family ATPase, partial [Desulfobulbaceae bacterium]|nr:AAA family ATPase [Desulfobulbaceae bacterium]
DSFLSYDWPGNIRELENIIERSLVLSQGNTLETGDPFRKIAASSDQEQSASLADVERQHICNVLEATGWVVSGEKGAAKILGLKPTTLDARMKKLGIKRKK